jgi:hypothetical protein
MHITSVHITEHASWYLGHYKDGRTTLRPIEIENIVLNEAYIRLDDRFLLVWDERKGDVVFFIAAIKRIISKGAIQKEMVLISVWEKHFENAPKYTGCQAIEAMNKYLQLWA